MGNLKRKPLKLELFDADGQQRQLELAAERVIARIMTPDRGNFVPERSNSRYYQSALRKIADPNKPPMNYHEVMAYLGLSRSAVYELVDCQIRIRGKRSVLFDTRSIEKLKISTF